MAFKRRFARRPFRRSFLKRRKPDVLQLSLCHFVQTIGWTPETGFPNCNRPATDVYPICIGSSGQDVFPAVVDAASSLAVTATKGARVSALRFDYNANMTCVIDDSSNNCGDTQSQGGSSTPTVCDMYLFMVKAEYDVRFYQQTGQVLPTWTNTPNLLQAPVDQVANVGTTRMLWDPEVDIFWRRHFKMSDGACCPCPPPISGDCVGASGTVLARVTGAGGYPTDDASAFKLHRFSVKPRRFLKENEGIFLVWNYTVFSPLSSGHFIVQQDLFGNAAVYTAR